MRVYIFSTENAPNGNVKTVIINAQDLVQANQLLLKHLKSLGRENEWSGFKSTVTANDEVIHTEYERDAPLQYRTEF